MLCKNGRVRKKTHRLIYRDQKTQDRSIPSAGEMDQLDVPVGHVKFDPARVPEGMRTHMLSMSKGCQTVTETGLYIHGKVITCFMHKGIVLYTEENRVVVVKSVVMAQPRMAKDTRTSIQVEIQKLKHQCAYASDEHATSTDAGLLCTDELYSLTDLGVSILSELMSGHKARKSDIVHVGTTDRWKRSPEKLRAIGITLATSLILSTIICRMLDLTCQLTREHPCGFPPIAEGKLPAILRWPLTVNS